MRRTPRFTPFVSLIASLALLPCSAFAAGPPQHDIRWVSSTPLDDLPSAYLAESLDHGFDAWIASDGVRAQAVDGAWHVGLTLVAVGRNGAMKEAAPAGVEAHGNRAELHRGSLTEWYINDERGLEQGFTLEERPAGTDGDELILALELTGDLMPLVAGSGRRLDLLQPGNPLPVAVYGGLVVTDADGLELPARLELGAGTESGSRELRIVVTDADAAYPITVDPLLTTAVWSSSESDDTEGVAWGDWDGDLDLAAGNTGVNRVYANTGGALTALWSSAEADTTVSMAWGDWDGDGDLDLAAGNWNAPNRVYSNDGLGQANSLTSVWTSGDAENSRSVAWGDWNGDGDLDLAAGNDGNANRVYENDGLGLANSLTSAWTSAETEYTRSVAWGDWDGDGDLDLAAGNASTQANRVYENGWLQRPGGLPETPVSPTLPDRPGATNSAFFFSAAECLTSPVTVDYILTDEESDPALRVTPEFSIVGRAGWQPATEGPGGSGTTNLPTDPRGWDHRFVWDSSADSVLWGHDVRFRITVPHQASTQVAGPILRGAMSATSPPFRICGIPADVAVTKDDGVTHVTQGQLLTYTITVSHNGGVGAANGVQVIDDFPAALSGVAWICLEDGGGSCSAASGTGDIDTLVDLPVGTYVTFMAAGTVTAAGGEGVTNTVELLASPVAPDPNLANNTATDHDVGWLVLFADGFETGDVSQWSASSP